MTCDESTLLIKKKQENPTFSCYFLSCSVKISMTVRMAQDIHVEKNQTTMFDKTDDSKKRKCKEAHCVTCSLWNEESNFCQVSNRERPHFRLINRDRTDSNYLDKCFSN